MAPHYAAAWAWAGNTPFQWGKQVASHLGGTRDPMVIHWPATGRRQGRGALALDARHRRRPDDPRVAGIPAPRLRRRHRPAADPRHAVHRFARRGRRAGAPHAAVLRVARQPGDVQGRLVAGDEDRPHPVGRDAGRDQAVRARRLEPGRRPDRAVLPAGRLQPGPRPRRRAPGQGRASFRELFWQEAERYDVLPLLAACPRSSASSRRCRTSPGSSSAATSQNVHAGHDPARLQPLLHDQRRPRGARPAARRA